MLNLDLTLKKYFKSFAEIKTAVGIWRMPTAVQGGEFLP